MKKYAGYILISLSVIIYAQLICAAQEIPVNTEQQLENFTDAGQAETEDDAYLQDLEQFRKHPLNLNMADADELKQLRIINELQIENLISYRRLLGNLTSIYELQAVPAWDLQTIRKLFPFIKVELPIMNEQEAKRRLRDGEHSIFIRISQVIEKSKGFDRTTAGARYLGSPQRVLFRYRYTYKNLLQFGLVGDKDAGEQIFKGAQKKGFDFYSFHLFARKIGIIQTIALGDFTVNLGQGLIQWQGLAFKKSADVMGVKRQSAILRPYSSAGEFYFSRGAGITIRKGRMEATIFSSVRKLSANFVTDTVNNEYFISSFLTSGYHRTTSETADKNKLIQTTFGGNISFRPNPRYAGRWHLSANGVYYNFSFPVQKRSEPYNLYAINGDSWYNFSIDYGYSYKNLHFFGEAAVDKNFSKAFVNGLLVSVDPKVDLSLVQRIINAAYQAVYGNAFTESTYPGNETGYYAGISIRPATGLRLDAYADIFKFTWLKYLVDGPSHGRDYMAQITVTPNRQVEFYTRYRNETRETNQPDNATVTNYLVSIPKQSWRTHASYKINTAISVRNRIELLWYDNNGVNMEKGFLLFFDFIYRPLMTPWSAVLRLQYFETDGYNSRLYAYENDVLYSYSIPAFFDKGYRYCLTLNYDLSRKVSVWLRWAQSIYNNRSAIGSGLDEINGNKKSEIKLQVRYLF